MLCKESKLLLVVAVRFCRCQRAGTVLVLVVVGVSGGGLAVAVRFSC